MSQSLYNRWSLEMRRQELFHSGERIGVAVSGGPDSVLLLNFLAQFSRETGLTLAVIHFNHHLRGEEADADEKFVRRLARGFHFPFFRGEASVSEEASKRRQNIEATAREFRYRFFLDLIRQGRIDKVATAHTLDDQAETVLLHILRGTGTKGLGGIHPSVNGKILRPFLNMTRAGIETEIRERGIEFRVDSTNSDTHFRRNKVRKELLPLLEKEFNPEIKRLLADTAARARADEAYLDQQAREHAAAWRVRDGQAEKIPRRALQALHPALARRVLRQMVQSAQGNLRGITYRHIEALHHFALEATSGKKLLLQNGLTARIEFMWLILSVDMKKVKPVGFEYPVVVPGTLRVPEIGSVFTFKILDVSEARKSYNENEWPQINPLSLPERLVFRNWRHGDRYFPVGRQKPVKVKELFGRYRVPANERDLWPLLDSERGIVCGRRLPAARWSAEDLTTGKILVIIEKVLA